MAILVQVAVCLLSTLQLSGAFLHAPLPRAAARTAGLPVMTASFDTLKSLEVQSAATGDIVAVTDTWVPLPGKKLILCFWTHFADFNSWEYAQKLVYNLPAIDDAGASVVAVGLGTPANARLFAAETGFPLTQLYCDSTGAAYRALGFAQGFKPRLPGDVKISPYLRLLPMLAGISSPGTIPAVLRGYIGDRDAKKADWIGSAMNIVDQSAFDVLGTDGVRPLEVATLRLQNMALILKNWQELSPPDKELITQQGGTLVLDGTDVIYEFKDKGILVYADIDEVLQAAGVEKAKVATAASVA